MAPNNKLLLRHPQLAERRREHTLARLSILGQAQMQARPPLHQAVNPPQAQAHSDTLSNKHSSLLMACRSSQHMVSQVT
jgi:hypothetical protein